MQKQSFVPVALLPFIGGAVGSGVSSFMSKKVNMGIQEALERLAPSEDPARTATRLWAQRAGLGIGAAGGTLLGSAIGDEYGVPVPGALIGALAGAGVGHSGGKLLGENMYDLNKHLVEKYPRVGPYALGAGVGGLLGGSLGTAIMDDNRVLGGVGGALAGGGIGALIDSMLSRKGIMRNVLAKKASILPMALAGGAGAAALASSFGLGNVDSPWRDVLLRRALPGLLAGGAAGGLLGYLTNRDEDNV